MKRLIPASVATLLFLPACGTDKSAHEGTSADSHARHDSIAAATLADSLAAADSIAAVDSTQFTAVIKSGSVAALLDMYRKQSAAVYAEYGDDGYPLGEHPQALRQAIRLRQALAGMENRMDKGQKADYDSISGYIRRFL